MDTVKQKSMIGIVASTRMDKTVVVAVVKTKEHRLYHKTYKQVVKYKVHDELNECKVDDKVRIVGTRPLSKEKHWRVDEIITRAEAVDVKPGEVA